MGRSRSSSRRARGRTYARPRLGGDPRSVRAQDVSTVRARQRELGVPEALEWVDEVTPGLTRAAAGAGLVVDRYPLLVLDEPLNVAVVPDAAIRLADGDDPAIPAARAAVGVGFATGGTEVGDAGVSERDDAASGSDGAGAAHVRSLIAAGLAVIAVADSADGPLGGGTASLRGEVAELMGIATLPASRRRGIGAAITAALVAEVRRRGVELAFLSASDDDVARIYERAGFRRFATACIGRAESSA